MLLQQENLVDIIVFSRGVFLLDKTAEQKAKN